jgi:hypothetical protein
MLYQFFVKKMQKILLGCVVAKNCLTCKTRIKADAGWDESEGDYWHCTAVVPVQGFGVMWLENRNLNPHNPKASGRLINLNLFRPEHKHFKSGIDYDCMLWSAKDAV